MSQGEIRAVIGEPELTCGLAVTVKLYGRGTAEDAAEALRSYRGTFELPGDREVEILEVKVIKPLITGNHPRQDGATYPLHG